MKLITFLGTGNYEETTYCWGERAKCTRFLQEALVEWLQPKCVVMLLTEQARSKNWDACKARLQGITEIHEVSIPDGKSEQELWQIFEAIDSAVEKGDTLAYDITHSFRSLPMITLLAIAYLKQVKEVQLMHLLYGVFEAKDEQGRAPVFELTPFAELLDWLTAAKMFIATGDSRELASLLEREQNEAWREHRSQPPRSLKSLASALESVSNNLLLSRVPHLANSVEKLQQGLKQAQSEIRVWTPLLVPLLEQIEQAYSKFANDDLKTQLDLIEWYLQRGHIVQAMTLAREWLISYQAQQISKDWRNRNHRVDAECTLNKGLHEKRDDPLTRCWSQVIVLRNDLAHCGFGRAEGQVLEAKNIIGQAREVHKQLRDICKKAFPPADSSA